MIDDLEMLQKYIDQMQSTSSANEKKKILEKWTCNDFIMDILIYVNSPYITFGVKSSQCKKYKSAATDRHVPSLYYLLDELRMRRFTGHDALHLVNSYVRANPSYEKLIYSVIDRDIETRANTSLINDVVPYHVPEWKVALAKPYANKLANFKTEEWFGSRKLDGVRSPCRIDDNGEIQFYSRTGKKFDTLGIIKADMYQLGLEGLVLDGEICIEKDGLEDFTSVIKEVRKKNHTIKNPKYYIFDCLTIKEFDEGVSTATLEERLKRIPKIKNTEILGQVLIKDEKMLQDMRDHAAEEGWEGVMVRKNCGYKGKRSNDLLKCKNFIDAEFEVKGCIMDNMRFFEDGIDVERETLSAVGIEHKGNLVKVGSGFSKEQRALYYENPDEIIGKIITVQYFEETTNSKGEISLRFPTIKAVHGTERTT